MTRAVYAGSFDPITNGHLYLIEQGSRIFDELIVAIGKNADKDKSTFSLDERVDMIRRVALPFPNVKVDSFVGEYLVRYAKSAKADFILRGIRNIKDYMEENSMRQVNSDLDQEIETVYLIPPRDLTEISSSFVKGLIGPNGWEEVIGQYVPRDVYNRFLIKFDGLKKRWDSMWNRLSLEPSKRDDVYKALMESYGDPVREYHNFAHISDSLKEFDTVRDRFENPDVGELCIWGHDCVYDPKRKDNEIQSTFVMEALLEPAGLERELIKSVSRRIIGTDPKLVPQDSDGGYIRDIDFSILGQKPSVVMDYERGIRAEYSYIPRDKYNLKRKEFLRSLLDKDIFSTEEFSRRYEAKARDNIRMLLDSAL